MLDPEFYDRVSRAMVRAYLSTDGMSSHQMGSYEHFLHYTLPAMICELPIRVYAPKFGCVHDFQLTKPRYSRPTVRESGGFLRALTPAEAYMRKMSYMFGVVIDIEHRHYQLVGPVPDGDDASASADGEGDVVMSSEEDGGEKKAVYRLVEHRVFENVVFFEMMAMVGSSVCNDHANLVTGRQYDGVFIVNGHPKCVISQEYLLCNYTYVFPVKTGRFSHRAEVRSEHQSASYGRMRSTSTLYVYLAHADTIPEVTVRVPYIKDDIPIVVIFRMLGVRTVAQMLRIVVGSAASPGLRYLVQGMLSHDASNTLDMSMDDICDWVGLRGSTEKRRANRVKYIRHIFCNEFLPHCDGEHGDLRKQCYLGRVVRKLMRCYMGELPVDDIDDYDLKRACVVGRMLALLVRQHIRNAIKYIHIQVFKAIRMRKYINAFDYFNANKITNALRYPFTTGNWNTQKRTGGGGGGSTQEGVCQMLNVLNADAILSQLNMLNTPMCREGKMLTPRQLRAKAWGLICPAETPEGKAVGLLNPFTLLCRVRVGYPSWRIIEVLVERGMVSPILDTDAAQEVQDGDDGYPVFVNGIFCGYTREPERMVEQYREMRAIHTLPIDTSVVLNDDEVCIQTDAGDMYRPLLRVAGLHKLRALYSEYGQYPGIFWNKLLIERVVVYITKAEERTLVVALRPQDTAGCDHLELPPNVALMGISAGKIPFSSHNQAPRVIYYTAMAKQAIAAPQTYTKHIAESVGYTLDYPQRALCTTMMEDVTGLAAHPSGVAAVVAIMIYSGENQEDSVVLNQSAIERGFARTTVTRTYKDTEASHGTDTERFCVPDTEKVVGRHKGDYSKLEPDGLVAPGQAVEQHDVLMGKTSRCTVVNQTRGSAVSTEQHRDRSTLSKYAEPARVDKVLVSSTRDGLRMCTTTVRSSRSPEAGDKFCLTSDHDVLTPTGWLPIAEVDDRTLLWTQVDGQGGWQYPTSVYRYEPADVMLARCSHMCVTDNHRLVVVVPQPPHSPQSPYPPRSHQPHQLSFPTAREASQRHVNIAASYVPLHQVPVETDEPLGVFLCVVAAWMRGGGRLSDGGDIELPSGPRVLEALAQMGWDSERTHENWVRVLVSDVLPMVTGAFSPMAWKLILREILWEGPYLYSQEAVGFAQRAAALSGTGGLAVRRMRPITKNGVAHRGQTAWGVQLRTAWETAPGDWDIFPARVRTYCVEVRGHIFYVRPSLSSLSSSSSQWAAPHWTHNSSRHGQKGVCGSVLRQEDMPFTVEGIVPDMIVNVHAIPSRMTIGHLNESYAGKMAALSGRVIDCTPFKGLRIPDLQSAFKGLPGNGTLGKEVMYCGKTGKQLTNTVFIGIVYYHALKFQVKTKLYARNRGVCQIITRQPIEGRSREGGFRFGEMERDALMSHGASFLLRDRLMNQSDRFETNICRTCGHLAESPAPAQENGRESVHSKIRQLAYCRFCRSDKNTAKVVIPYAFKLLTQELAAMHVGLRFELETDEKRLLP